MLSIWMTCRVGKGGGEIGDEMFKPPDDVQKATIEVAEEQDGKMTDAENEVGEGGVGEVKPHPENKNENGILVTGGNETVTGER